MRAKMSNAPEHADIAWRLRVIMSTFDIPTARAFGERFNVSESRLNNWMKGIRRPAVDAGIAICREFGLTLDWLYLGVVDGLDYRLVTRLREAEAGLRSHGLRP